MSITNDPAFAVYGATAAVLAVHMVLLDAYSGLNRARSKTTPNDEDASTVSKGSRVEPDDPPQVARIMRAHRNLLANSVPFLIVGLVWVLMGASTTWALILFGTFVVARLIHSVAYASAKQPWRTLSFVIGQLAMAGIVVQVLRGAFAVL
jgi:prostaglandin-E synthase 1